MKDYTDTLHHIDKRMDSLKVKKGKGLVAEGIADSLFSRIRQERFITSTNFKKRNINNLAGKIIFKRGFSIINAPDFEEIYNLADDDLKSDIEVVKHIRDRENWKLLNENRYASIGRKYSDFEAESLNGKIRISNYVGKSDILLIDFWASWCGPCIAEFPHLKALYEKYQKKGLSILSVSIDDSRTRWMDALSKYNMPWDQIIIEKKDQKEIMKAYKMKGIPYIILLDTSGKILAVNLRGELLSKKIEELLTEE